ncbi:hypothetical protein [Serratia ureilytica]|uniref:hypothetical protein n=1 Tax=Serratia ureilytica TaxID=300181 RepID=UPI003D023FDD
MKNLVRVKWNRMKSSLSIEEITSHIINNMYSESTGYGYSEFKTQDDIISARYTEAKVNVQTSIDPLGNESEQEFISYESIEFSMYKLTNRLYLLSIYNPPKSVRSLTDRLSMDSNYQITFSLVDIRLSEYITKLREHHNMSLVNIKKAKISNLVINDNAKASIEITSKHNALDDIKSIINEKTYTLDKIKATGHIFNSACDFEISKNGILSAKEEMVSYFTETVIEHILEREM